MGDDCIQWTGPEKLYQAKAVESLRLEAREPSAFAWITPTCDEALCLHPDHLAVHSPVRLAYPHSLCIYCGRPGWAMDHLLPRSWTGDIRRHFVVLVPACGVCNGVLADALTWSITERRALCHERLRRRYRKVLATKDYTEDELAEFGKSLRAYIKDEIAKKAEVLQMLEFPFDSAFDARALERSGITDPYRTGLLLGDDEDLGELIQGHLKPNRKAA